ncbi:MAG: nickel-dependent lactate racemase [Chloroflexi bacterium]|nr:MAG: nickel-dependent lactate racemase [Chloroflexota bacterium]
MTRYTLPYGKTTLTFTLPDDRPADLLAPRPVPAAANPAAVVKHALDHPVGGPRLADLPRPRTAAIAINDKTRPVPHHLLLPPLLARLEALGLPPTAITLVIATGTHPPMAPSEFQTVVPPDILARYPVVCHNAYDPDTLTLLGQTRRGTPVWVNRRFAQADLRIVVGNLEPHQFMGFSGGVKSAAIGLAGAETVNRNHALMADPQSRLGEYERNPARQDVEEIGRIIGIHFALNALLNDHKQLVDALAGDPQAVMKAGIPRVRALFQVEIEAPYDLLIASPGGYPKDINVYQAQKGLAHAALATREGGTVILAAACPEGSGSDKYEQWVAGKRSHREVVARFEAEGFRVGPHKAFQIARDALRVRLLLVSDMPDSLAGRLLLPKVPGLEQALQMALADLPPAARIGVMPLANATIPLIKS